MLIKAIADEGKKLFASISFLEPKWKKEDHPVLTLKASDGREVRYTFHKSKKRKEKHWRYYLMKVERPTGPTEEYRYSPPSDEVNHEKVLEKRRPDGRVQQIDYYSFGDNKIGDTTVHVSKKLDKDNRIGKVSQLKAPVGEGQELIITHRFFYSEFTNEHTYGVTDVRDAVNHKVLYTFSPGHHLTQIRRFVGTNEHIPYSQERFYWGSNANYGDLICKTLCEADGQIRSCRYLEYDDRYNVIAGFIFGNLSGKCTIRPSVNDDGMPLDNGCEYYVVDKTFSNDGLNLPLSESLPNGRKTLYAYWTDTDRLAAKYVGEQGKINTREFHEYDLNGCEEKSIIDDGSGLDSADLTNVTLRRITEKALRKTVPCFGLAECISQSYYDAKTGTTHPLGFTRNTYSKEGWITEQKVHDSNGDHRYTLEWKYDGMGNVLEERNALGQLIERRFDANGNKIYECGPNRDFWTNYTYDFSNRLIAEEQVCVDGERFSQSYHYDLLGYRDFSVDLFGNKTRYEYDDFGRLICTKLPAYHDAEGHLVELETRQEYDIAGNITMEIDALGQKTCKQYNIRGQPTLIEYPDGTQESFEYNLDGTLFCQVALNGTKTELYYDVLGNVIRKETFSSSGEHLTTSSATYRGTLLTSETDANTHVTNYSYDAAGRLVKVSQEECWTTFEYDALGRKYKTLQWAGPGDQDLRITVTEYDLLNRPIEERIEDSSGQVFTKVQTKYDEAGNVSAVITYGESGAVETQTVYNAQGRPIKVIDAEGNETHTHYNFRHINEQGDRVLQITIVDAMGNQTITTQDVLGRSVSAVRKDRMGVELARTQQVYDGKGNLIRRIDTAIAGGEVLRESITEWKYDPVGHIVALNTGFGTSQARSTCYSYNQFGEKIADFLADDRSIDYEYDPLGRLVHYSTSDSAVSYRYVYDALGNILSVTDEVNNTVTQREYDRTYRLTEEKLGNGLTMSYSYDGLGRIIAIELPDRTGLSYSYNAMHLKEVNRTNSSNHILYTHRYLAHDLSGHVTQAQMIGRADDVVYKRDKLSRLTQLSSIHFEESVPEGGYDAVGNLLKKTRRDIVSEEECCYTYDSLNQLLGEEGVGTHSYSHDSLNNRLSKDGTPCIVDSFNQLLQQGEQHYHYDPLGNRVLEVSSEGEKRYVYDALGRLIQVQTSNGRWEYRYDAFNRRICKIHYDPQGSLVREERYLYHDQMEIGAVDANGTLYEFRALGKGLGAEIGAAVAVELYGVLHVPIHDQNGNVVSLVRAHTNEVVEVYRYSAFGEERTYRSRSGDIEEGLLPPINPWRFASKRSDPETGWLNFGRRYYDPAVGRWTTPDPRGFEDGPNLYAYVHNNPLTHIDLYGLSAQHCSRCGRPLSGSSTMDRVSDMVQRTREYVAERLFDLGHHLMPIGPIQRAWARFCRLGEGKGLTLPDDYQRSSGVYLYPGNGERQTDRMIRVTTNGICNTFQDAWNHAAMLSERHGGVPVLIAYNSTRGFVADLLESVAQIVGIPTRSVEICQMAIRVALMMAGPSSEGGSVFLEAHSQGGLILDRALKGLDYAQRLSRSEMKMIDVVTIGSAKIINDQRFGSCTNIIDRRDLVSAVADPFNYYPARLGMKDNNVRWVGSHLGSPAKAHERVQPEYQRALRRTDDEIFDRRGLR